MQAALTNLAYPMVALASTLPFAFLLWRSWGARDLGVAWLGGLTLSSILTVFGLYFLALAQLVRSPIFLVSLPLLNFLPYLVFHAPAARGEARAFLRATLGALVSYRLFWGFALALHLGTAIFASRLYPHFYDSWNYHLPISALAVSAGGIPVDFEHPYVISQPPFLELWRTWLWLAFRHAGLLEITQLPFGVALAATGVLVARGHFGARRWLAALAGLFVLASPKLLENALSSYLDVYEAFYIAAGIYFFAAKRYSLGLLASLAAVAFKYSAIGSAALPLALCTGALLLRDGWRGRALVIVVVPLFFSWFLLNFDRFRNPLYPYIFQSSSSIPGIFTQAFPRLFACPSPEPCWDGFYVQRIEDVRNKAGSGFAHALSLWRSWVDTECLYYEEYLARWGPAFGALALAGVLATLALYLCSPSRVRRPRHRSRALLLGVSLVSLYFTVKPQESRLALFTLPVFFACGIYWAQLLQRLAGCGPRRALVTLALLALLGWTTAHAAARQGRLLKFWREDFAAENGAGALLFSMPHPGAQWVHGLARVAQTECAASPLLIDFSYGLRHEYGFAPAAAHAFVRRDWRLPTTSRRFDETSAAELHRGVGLSRGHCVLTFRDSALWRELRSAPSTAWRELASNELGSLYRYE